MKENPYSEFINVMKNQSKGSNLEMKIAKVTHVSDANINIEVDELVIDKDNIYISDHLLKGYKREIETEAITDLEGIERLKINHADVYYKDTLKVGDLVSVISTADRQTYIILSKVVRYGE